MAPDKTDEDSATNVSTASVETNGTETEHEPFFEPVVHLPLVQVRTNEEEEEEMLRMRCKLFRYHPKESPPEWKERGTGDVKLLKHPDKKSIRLVMRQDKTLKIRANHYITPYMELKPNCSTDRAWVWSVRADFADEEPKQETFAIKFANTEYARIFREKFDEARGIVTVAQVRERQEREEQVSQQEENTSAQGNREKDVLLPSLQAPQDKNISRSDDEKLSAVEEDVALQMEKLHVEASGTKDD